jgi:hypothetical protein
MWKERVGEDGRMTDGPVDFVTGVPTAAGS